MSLSDRLNLFLLGCALGFIAGYVVSSLRQIKKGLRDVDESVKRNSSDERGIMSHRVTANIALFLVVVMCLYASIMSQAASNKANNTSDKIIEAQTAIVGLQTEEKHDLLCTTQILFSVIEAVNGRTTYSGASSDANYDLVKAQHDLLVRGRDPNLTPAQGEALLDNYVAQVKVFLHVVQKNKKQQELYPFPTVQDLTDCLKKPLTDKEK